MQRTNLDMQKVFLVFGIVCGLYLPLHAQNDTLDIRARLPGAQELGAWHLTDSVRVLNGEDLFTLIDGGADIYYEYGFRRVAAAGYQNIQEHSVKVEIYEMTDAAAAYGMYSLNASSRGKKIPIGDEATLSSYFLTFWRNSFLVYLTGADTADETTAGILFLAAWIDRKLGPTAQRPELMKRLPAEGLITAKYFRGMLGLSSLYTFDTQDIFRMKEGAAGIYPTHRLLLMAYDSGEEAGESLSRAAKRFSAGTRFSKIHAASDRCTMTDQKGAILCLIHFGNLIAVIISDNQSDIGKICDGVISSLRQK